ncbi:MAG: hypothetical protein KC656_02485 [Myxococcales bacterium]|nr:hypothetical protein [Myxococcales bacterium]
MDRATLKKLQLLVKREHEILKLRGRLRAHGTWMQRVERITGAMATAPTVESAIGTLATELLCESPYEIAWVHSRTGYQDLFGGSLTDAELEEVRRTSERWWDPEAGVHVVDIPPDAPSGTMWLLGGNVLSEHGVEAVVVVGRTSRTAGYYVPPWDGDVTHLGHLLHTARHVLSAVAQRVGLNDQVLEATKRLRVALDEANQANRAKSVFLANMSHELRTPLNAIIGYAELVAGDAEDQGLTDMMEDLGRIRTAGHLLLGLISDILDLSKIEAGRVEVELSDFDLRTVIDSVATTLRPLVEERGNTLELDLDPTVGQVHLDERKVRQVLTNLLGNASKFTTEGSIRVRSRACEDDVCIEVSDTGVGMPEDVLDRIFDPFYQVRQSDQGAGPGGTGLGLAISHRFCRMLGGDLTVQSALGRGSTFVVRVPSGRG